MRNRADVRKEVSQHLADRYDELRASGRSHEEATQAVAAERAEFEAIGRSHWLGDAAGDLRYGLRTLRNNAVVSAVVIVTLALGIGATTALFSIVNGVLLNPLPYPQPEQLVRLHESKVNFPNGSISFLNFRDWRDQNHTFSAMAVSRPLSFTLTGRGEPEQIRGALVSSDFFRILGIEPLRGRFFEAGEDEIGAAPRALVSASLWRRKFASDAAVVGQAIVLDGQAATIVGVVPDRFQLTVGDMQPAGAYVPIGQWLNPALTLRTAGLGIHGIGRLRPGVTIEQARADLDRVTRDLAAAYPIADKGVGATMVPLKEEIVGNVRPYLLALLGAVGFVLLIACVNVASVLLARAMGRVREVGVRVALGAGVSRIVRQLLAESLLLALIGGGLGVWLAAWGTHAALRLLPAALPRAAEIAIDGRVLAFTALVTIVAGIVFGLAPARQLLQASPVDALKDGGRGFSAARQRMQSVFVAAEIGFAVALLVGAGLMMRSLTKLWSVDPGFDSRQVLTFGLSLPAPMRSAPPTAIREALRQVDATIAGVPAVRSVSLSWAAVPFGGDEEALFWFDGEPKPSSQHDMKWALSYVVDPDYLKTMGIGLQRGRFFTERDNERTPPVAVVDEVFARQFFFGDAIGRRLRVDGPYEQQGPVEVVGVVRHVKQWGLDADDRHTLRAQLYIPLRQISDRAMSLAALGTTVLVRADGDASNLFTNIRAALTRESAENVAYGAAMMDDLIAGSLASRRFSVVLFAAFGAAAVLLAALGVYGVLSHLVGQRTREIGVRVALGAQPGDVLRLLLTPAARMTIAGTAAGLVGGLAIARVMARYSMLFGVSAVDPLTLVAVPAVLAAVALAACLVPARRAIRADPLSALRSD